GVDYPQRQGEIMLFLPNQFHSQYADRDQRVFYTTIGFSMQFGDPEYFRGRIFPADHEARNLFRRIFEERDFGRIYGNDLILCYLKELIIGLLRTGQMESVVRSVPPESRPALENTIVSAAEDYVKKHLKDRLTVSEIAGAIPVSETYLSVLFKKVTGESLNHFINTQKLELARDYILSGRYTFTQIAQLLGYNNVHYFSQSFKRYLGMTPSAYAKLHKGEA
ncbi:MAG: helix-turn-helix transcriptional regulator, partial [Clostridia bacterium]